MRSFGIAIFAIVIALITAQSPTCSAQEEKEKNLDNIRLPKLKNYEVELVCLTGEAKRTFSAGGQAVLVFGLKNIGANPLSCLEWHIDEPDNIVINYARVNEDGGKAAKEEWRREVPAEKKRKRLSPLQLAPGNTVLIDKPLAFISDLGAETGKPQTYLVYAELNLKTMSARSPVVKIRVLPASGK